jgi:hypothetical protein
MDIRQSAYGRVSEMRRRPLALRITNGPHIRGYSHRLGGLSNYGEETTAKAP